MPEQEKLCPLMAMEREYSSRLPCIGAKCAWWCEFAGCCAVPLTAGILADSSICMNQWDTREMEG